MKLPLVLLLAPSGAANAAAPAVSIDVAAGTGVYTVSVGGQAFYQSPSAGVQVCVAGNRSSAKLAGAPVAAQGTDGFGAWTGETASYSLDGGATTAVQLTFQHYAASPEVAVATATFPSGLDTSNCGPNTQLSTAFPSFDTAAAKAASLHTLSWRGEVISETVAAMGLGNLGANGLDCGPVASTDPASGNTLVFSSLTAHKILPQATTRAGVCVVGHSCWSWLHSKMPGRVDEEDVDDCDRGVVVSVVACPQVLDGPGCGDPPHPRRLHLLRRVLRHRRRVHCRHV